jgi:NAD(P)-dependent dehydrogenase (short-subunit alcohol dehydrogenase family)
MRQREVSETRSVVVTGASRGLGRATAAHLHRRGWTVLAAMRSPDRDISGVRAAAGAADDDERLIPISLDLDDQGSVDAAVAEISGRVGAPDGVVHNAGLAGVGSIEEMPIDAWQRIFSTNVFGPVRLTKALMPAMRAAGRGRIVLISSQGAVRGMPAIGAYSGAKGALERWGEALAHEIAPFGLGVSVIVTGTFKTDILELTTTWEDTGGPYAPMHLALRRTGDRIMRIAGSPDAFAPAVERALHDTRPISRRGVGIDGKLLLLGGRLLPGTVLHRLVRLGVGIPGPGSLLDDPRRHATVTPDIDAVDSPISNPTGS